MREKTATAITHDEWRAALAAAESDIAKLPQPVPEFVKEWARKQRGKVKSPVLAKLLSEKLGRTITKHQVAHWWYRD